jgi:hypothetical protein
MKGDGIVYRNYILLNNKNNFVLLSHLDSACPHRKTTNHWP